MKALGYFLYGIITALAFVMFTFNQTMEIVLDDYYVDLFYGEWQTYWSITSITIAILYGISSVIWIYNQGKGANEHETLLTNKKENE